MSEQNWLMKKSVIWRKLPEGNSKSEGREPFGMLEEDQETSVAEDKCINTQREMKLER